MRLSYVYLIGPQNGPFKIGRATDAKKRAVEIQVGCWEDVIVHHTVTCPYTVAHGVEQRMHKRFSADHLRGEWFKVDLPTLVETLEAYATEASSERAKSNYFDPNECLTLCDDPARAAVCLSKYRNDARNGRAQDLNKRLLDKVGVASQIVFTQVVLEGRNLTAKFRGQSRLARQAEQSLIQALNGLCAVYADIAKERSKAEDKIWASLAARRAAENARCAEAA